MSTITISLLTLVLTFAGSLCGLFLRYLLPDNHLNEDARDVVKLGSGVIGSIAALMLGLLINSANNSLATISNELTETSTTIVELDDTMASYGSETAELRQLLRKIVVAVLEAVGPENILKERNTEKIDVAKELRKMQSKLRSLSPKNNAPDYFTVRGFSGSQAADTFTHDAVRAKKETNFRYLTVCSGLLA